MAGIRFMGLCPCPRCLVKKTELLALGTPMDDRRRAKIRVNDYHFRTKVSIARTIIYGQGRSVNNDAVNDLLKEKSLVPTTVCPQIILLLIFLSCVGYPTECIPHKLP